MELTLQETTLSDESFLFSVYASTRADEMALVPWNEEQKKMFLQAQFQAQQQQYQAHYPNASWNVIKLDNEPVGRLYTAELVDEIRIIDLTFLPEHFDKDIFVQLVKEILQRGEDVEKPVQIYLESFNPLVGIFTDLGFQKVDEYGIYFLWRYHHTAVRTDIETSTIST